MDSIIQMLVSQLADGAVGNISDQLGIDEQKTQQAVGMALPVIIGALNRNTSSGEGAQSLVSALQRDHDGSILDNLAQMVTKDDTLNDGRAILGHVLGDRLDGVSASVSRATGLEQAQVAQIFAMLAPVILGALGKQQRNKNLDAQGLSNLLQEERSSVEKTTSGLTQLLDMDGDGDVSEEIMSLGSNLLGGLFGSKK